MPNIKKLRHPFTNKMVPITYHVTRQVCNAYTTDVLPDEWMKAGILYKNMGYDILFHKPTQPIMKPVVKLHPLKMEPFYELRDTLKKHYTMRLLRNNTFLYEDRRPASLRSTSYYIIGNDLEVIHDYIQDLLLFYPIAGYGTLWRSCGTFSSDDKMVWHISHSTSCD